MQLDQYVSKCHSYHRSQSTEHSMVGVLGLSLISDCPWEDISINFVVGLPLYDRIDAL